MPTVPAFGTRLYYEERGAGPPLLLIHGTGGVAGMFATVAERLASSYRVITYDRRGFGRSEAPLLAPDESLRRHADDAAVLLRELGAPHATGGALCSCDEACLSTAFARAIASVRRARTVRRARRAPC